MIAIAALTLAPGQVGGSETYLRELLRALARVGALEYRAVLPLAAADAAGGLPAATLDLGANRGTAFARAVFDPRLRRYLAPADVVHYPLTVPAPHGGRRRAVTLHDVQHLDLPQLFSRRELAYRRVAYDRAARRADRVIVVSEFVKRRAVDRLRIDARRIHVTPLGVDATTLTPGGASREPFLLYPARPWPHKNHARLFAAFDLIRRQRPELRLVLTGGGTYDRLPDGVENRGHIPRAEVVDLLRRAAALVFPSLYEGFGLPPLEAMACACPVACSDRGALPEVVGHAARLFDPTDPAAIAEAVLDVLRDPGPWVERGLARAAEFSWDETARRTDAVYADLLM